MKHVLITGATGLIGQNIVKLCHENNWVVHYLTTHKEKIRTQPNYKGFYWDPKAKSIDENCFEDVTTIINLAGAPIAKRWTASYKKEIIESRSAAIQTLYNAIQANDYKVDHFISASAVGIYPTSLTNYYDEAYNNDLSQSFIVNVVQQWEATADSFKDINCRVSKIRIGLVLSNSGGVLKQITKPIINYVGTCIGSGKQWQSWIHIDDLSRLFLFVIENKYEGVYNGVSPNPVTHRALMKHIAKALKRPLWLPSIPTFVMKLMLGEMHSLITKGQRVSSKKIEHLGFNFEYHHLESALDDLL